MRCIEAIAPSILAVIAITSSAAAADVAAHPPVIEAAEAMPDETGAGWYLRGDIGAAVNVAPTMSWQSTAYTNRSSTTGASLGVGLGYRFSDALRSDVTLDFLSSRQIKGYLNTTDDDRLRQDSVALMINGYYDFGKFSGLTPYVGAGIGAARVTSGQLTRELSGTPTYVFGGSIHYSLAASASTGFSFDIGHGLQADVGYKFTWINGTRTSLETTSTLAGPVTIGASMSHQFRVGLKYFIN